MTKISFKSLRFEENADNYITAVFQNIFSLRLNKAELEAIAPYKLNNAAKNTIEFQKISQNQAEKKLNFLLEKGFKKLTNNLNKKPTVYIHQNSGIPLIGNNAFGIVDRNTNIIEIKPITACNLKCIYCSVDQDKRITDFYVEKDYIIKEIKNLIDFKIKKNINFEAHIGGQGEPLLYAELTELIKDLKKIKAFKTISIDTNATLLTEKKIDELVKAGLTRFNLSINAFSQEKAEKIAGTKYNLKHVKDMIEHTTKKCNLIIAPVMIPNTNEKEIEEIVAFVKELQDKNKNVEIGIQNFLSYKFGKHPAKQMHFNDFYKFLKTLEEKYKITLILDEKYFDIKKTEPLPKPCKKMDIVEAEIKCNGRLKQEMIGVIKDRNISIFNCTKKPGDKVKVKITRSKHNIFIGSCSK